MPSTRSSALRAAGLIAGAVVIAIAAWQLWPTGDDAAPVQSLELQYIAGAPGVPPFWIARTELTQEQWQAATGKPNPSDPDYGIGPRYPVNNITWDDAIEAANALSRRDGKPPCYEGERGTWRRTPAACRGYRLVGEAEWRFLDQRPRSEPPCATANLGDPTLFETRPRDVEELRQKLADVHPAACRDGYATLAPVGSLAPDSLGLFDLDGNVSEWIWNGTARSVRGSSFLSPEVRGAFTYGDNLLATMKKPFIGVRFARDDVR